MSRLDQLSLSNQERAELLNKANAAAAAAGIRSLIVVGAQNIAYLTGGVVFPYLDQQMVHPVALQINFVTGRSSIVCTSDLRDIPQDCGWSGEVVTYELIKDTPERSLAAALSAVMQQDGNEAVPVGFDASHMNGSLHRALMDSMPEQSLVPADAFLRDLRIIKTGAE